MKGICLAVTLIALGGCAQMVDYGRVTEHNETFAVAEVKSCSAITGSCYVMAKYASGKEVLTAVKNDDVAVGDVLERSCKTYEKMPGEYCDRYWHKASN